MKNLSKKAILTLIAIVMIISSALVGCSSSENEGANASANSGAKTKVGVLIYDPTDSQVVAFQKYYQQYIEKNFNVEFKFSAAVSSAEEEKSAIENFALQGAKGVIALTQADMVAAINQAAAAKMYYIVGVGTMTDEQYEATKENKYFIGTIGPDLSSEEKAGYDMAKSYIAQGFTNYVIYAGGLSYGVEAHVKRYEGMVRAFEEAGVTYEGKRGTLGKFTSDKYKITFMEGFPDDAGAFYTEAAQKLGEPGVEVLLTVGIGLEVFGATVAKANPEIKLATIASFTDAYRGAFNAEQQQVDYLAGTFSSMIGPSFAAVMNAVNDDGDSFRDNGQAFRISQNYWSATDKDTFLEMYKYANDYDNPVFNAEDLKSIIKADNPDANFDSFNELAENVEFTAIEERLAKRQ